MTTEYAIALDRDACDGVFACLVRDDRFVEADDGLAAVDGGEPRAGASEGGEVVVDFADGRVADARQAARACPVDAIDVRVDADDEGGEDE